MKRVILLLGLILLISNFVLSQGVTTSSISGVVTTQAGEPLPGANIIAVHEPSGTVYGTISRIDGRYNLPGLRVGGPYKVTVSYVGYASQEITGVVLALGQNLELNFKLAEEAIPLGEVVVVGQRTGLADIARTGPSANVLRQQIDILPTISRDFSDYYKLSPYFVGFSAVGRNMRYNNIQIDGANFNDLFGLGRTGAPAGQTGVTPISLEAIEEFQIVISPYDVRQGRFTGAGVNVVTRSGTNKLSGAIFYYGRNRNFIGVSPDTLKKKFDSFTEYQTGFRVGGPIIRNKLFYFINGEITRYSRPLTRAFGASAPGTNIYTVPVDSVTRFINILKNYGYDPGDFYNLKFNRRSDKILAKLDYNITNAHRLTLRYLYIKGFDDSSPAFSGITAPIPIYADNSKYKLDNTTNSVSLQLRSVFGSNIANEFIVAYTHIDDNPTYYGKPFPFVAVDVKDATGRYAGTLMAGSEMFRVANHLKQTVWELTNNLTYFTGSHAITIGTQNEVFSFYNLFIPYNFGAYQFRSLGDFEAKKPSLFMYQYSKLDPQWAANWKALQFSFYVQDEWSVKPGLKLTFGLRADIPTYPDKPTYNPKVDSVFAQEGYSTDKVPATTILWNPRLGFNWDVYNNRSLVLRGGVGLFSGRVAYVWISNQYSNTGMEFATIRSTAPPADFEPDPYNQGRIASQLSPVPTTTINLISDNFKLPQILRASLGIDKTLPLGFVGTIEGMYTKSINEILYKDVNLIQTGYLSDGRPIYGTWDYSRGRWNTNKRYANFVNVILLTNTSKGYAYHLTFQLERPSAPDGLYLKFAYTYGVSKDLNSGTSSIALSQWRFNHAVDPNNPGLAYSSFDRRHRVLTVVSYRYEWFRGLATTIGLFYNGLSGLPYSYVYNGDVNGDGQRENDLIYVPMDRNDIILVDRNGNELPKTHSDYKQLFEFIEKDEYLRTQKGRFAERMGARAPWSHQIDLRLAVEIPSVLGHKLEITFDILNFANLLNSNWGYIKSVNFQRVFPLRFHSLDPATGKSRFVWENPRNFVLPLDLASRWQAQIGVRYTF